MALFKSTTKSASLTAALADKGMSLRVAQDNAAQTADDYIRLAGDLRVESETHKGHAEAVEKAVRILEDAGVTL